MIKITARNFDLTNGIKGAITDKFEKFEKMIDKNSEIEVLLETKRYGQKVEVFFRMNNKLVKAESIDEDLYTAIDIVSDRLKSQISRYSGKLTNINNEESIRFSIDRKIEEEKETKIVRRKYLSNKPMMEEEAILQMELLGHRSFIFFNADEDATSMLYKRDDGDYGIIIKD